MVTSSVLKWISRIPPDFGQTQPKVHLWVFGPIFLLQTAWVIRNGTLPVLSGTLWFAAGLFAWTLNEYVLHRFSFHSKSEHPLIKPFNSSLHLLHHREPSSELYVAVPILPWLPAYLLLLLIFRVFTGGDSASAMTMGAGFTLGFIIYEHVHYVAHLRPAKSKVMRYLKKHHMTHHFADTSHLFGVTSPFWDVIFGTMKDRNRPASKPPAPTPSR